MNRVVCGLIGVLGAVPLNSVEILGSESVLVMNVLLPQNAWKGNQSEFVSLDDDPDDLSASSLRKCRALVDPFVA